MWPGFQRATIVRSSIPWCDGACWTSEASVCCVSNRERPCLSLFIMSHDDLCGHGPWQHITQTVDGRGVGAGTAILTLYILLCCVSWKMVVFDICFMKRHDYTTPVSPAIHIGRRLPVTHIWQCFTFFFLFGPSQFVLVYLSAVGDAESMDRGK